MPSLPEIVVQIPLPSVLATVTIAPGMGAFAELLTTPATAPYTGWTCAGAAGAVESCAKADCGPPEPVRTATAQIAVRVDAILEGKRVFISFLTSFSK
jgi:hypothetical protein